jgi:hypothetical protein
MSTLRSLWERRKALLAELQTIIEQHPEPLPDTVRAQWDARRCCRDLASGAAGRADVGGLPFL